MIHGRSVDGPSITALSPLSKHNAKKNISVERSADLAGPRQTHPKKRAPSGGQKHPRRLASMAGGILEVLVLLEGQGGGIEAEAQSGGPGAIIENMPKMGVASGAQDFHPLHAEAMVGMSDDVLLGHRLEKTGPAGAGIKLRFRCKQGQAATDAVIDARFMLIVKGAAKGRLRAFVAGDAILIRGQLFGPFRVGFDDFRGRDQRSWKTFLIEQTNLHHSDWIAVGVLGPGLGLGLGRSG